MTAEQQKAKAREAWELVKKARAAVCELHADLSAEQHACERRLSYAYDCLGDALGYLADAETFVTGAG